MPIVRSDLPPFGCLIAFEAVERTGSFTKAAKELRVSQAAISQKVGELETWLGARLVQRNRPRIDIIDDGLSVASAVRAGADSIAAALREVRERARLSNRVTLATTNAFALYWLGPKIQEFYGAHPDVELNLITADRDIDTNRPDFDLAIVFSSDELHASRHAMLFDESIIAVAAPSYVSRRPPQLEAGEWQDDSFLELKAAQIRWLSWTEWFDRTGMSESAGIRTEKFSSYIPLVQAVCAGRGIAIGRRRLVDPLITNGTLVQVGECRITSVGHYLLVSKDRLGTGTPEAVAELYDWLLAAARNPEPQDAG